MLLKVRRTILSVLILILTITNIAYAQPTNRAVMPIGPKVEELKGKERIIENLEKLKVVRTNLINLNITENTTDEQLDSIDKEVSYYLEQFNIIKRNLEAHKIAYKDSFPDVFFAEEIELVADSYIISIRQVQNLILALKDNKENSQKLFYSSYLIPAYYYLTLGDQMIAYVSDYFVVS